MFSYEYCEIFQNSFFYRTPPVTASICIYLQASAGGLTFTINLLLQFLIMYKLTQLRSTYSWLLFVSCRSCRLKMFFKIGVLKKWFRRKSLVLGSLLIRLQAHRPANLLKRDSNIGDFLQHRCFSCEICEIFNNTFKRTLSVTASDHGNDDRKSVNSYSRKSYDNLWRIMTVMIICDKLWFSATFKPHYQSTQS